MTLRVLDVVTSSEARACPTELAAALRVTPAP